MAAQYADWVTLGDIKEDVLVPLGFGAIVRRGLKKIAVYCDDAGQLHEQSAMCLHLGGIVAWNHSGKRGTALAADRDSTSPGKWSMGRLFQTYPRPMPLRHIKTEETSYFLLSNIDQTLSCSSGIL